MSDVQQIIEQIAAKTGTTAEAAWPLYVQYIWAEGMTETILGGLGLAVVLTVVALAARRYFGRTDVDATDASLAFTMGGMIVLIPLCCSVMALCDGLPKALAPAGAAIQGVVQKATR